ncbi:uncharacterized protein [Musca autumnalis]|uniref:uncharacterized protein n=1 Tax=Musca autumnalis TaxID=221902 RepID=UPI003CF7CEC8
MSAPASYKCRTCLSEEENKLFYQLYDSIVEESIIVKIVDILDKCLPQLKIKAETRLTQHICQECVNKLLSCHRFHQLCIQSNKQLLACFKNANQDGEEVGMSSLIEHVAFKVEQDMEEVVDYTSACEITPEDLQLKLDIAWKEEAVEEEEEPQISVRQQDYNNATTYLKLYEQKPIRRSKRRSEHRCPDCFRTFSNSHNLRRHSKCHDPIRPFCCSKCKYTFATERAYRRHKLFHSKKASEHKFQCPDCPKVFWEKSSLVLHAKSHNRIKLVAHPSETSERLATELGNKDVDKEMLSREEDNGEKTVNRGEKEAKKTKKQTKVNQTVKKKCRRKGSFQCTECGKKFSSSFNLQRHDKLLHDKTRPYACHICTYRFDTERRYCSHMWSQHQIQVPVEDEELNSGEEMNKTNATELKDGFDDDDDQEEEDFTDQDDDEDEEDDDDANDLEKKDDENYVDFVDTGIGEVEKPRSNYKRGHYPCNVCGLILGSTYRLNRHMPLHSMDRPYACQLCPYRFYSSDRLRRHLRKHEIEKNKPNSEGVQCPNCTRRFLTRASLAVHRRQVHRRNNVESTALKRKNFDIYYACKHCQKTFMSVISLTEHIVKDHPDIEKYNCTQCDKTFVLNALLQEHLYRHMGLPNVFCVICEKPFYNQQSLQDHMRVHIGSNRFICNLCGKQLSTESNLQQHMERHTTVRKWACNQCPSRFKCLMDLQKHKKTHQNLKQHVCEVCGSCYTRASTLRKHQAKHTGVKPYSCGQCDMRFVDVNHLQRHYRTHTGEKPYKCKFCDRAYAQSGDLNKHLRTHVGEKTYMCTQCPEAYKYYAELRQHIWEEHYKKTHQPQQEEEKEEEGVDQDNNQRQHQQESLDVTAEDFHIDLDSQEHQGSQMQDTIYLS